MAIIGLVMFFVGMCMFVYAGVIDQTAPLSPSLVVVVLGFLVCIISEGV